VQKALSKFKKIIPYYPDFQNCAADYGIADGFDHQPHKLMGMKGIGFSLLIKILFNTILFCRKPPC
jgi:hypothetical protein